MRKLLLIVVLATLLTLVIAATAKADPVAIPGGPWVTDEQTVSLDRVPTVQEVGAKLYEIEARSKGRLKVEVAGTSAGGYPIYLAKFGEPTSTKRGIMYEANVHGNELSGVLATLGIIQQLATGNSPEIQEILDNYTVWFMPMVNPDGAMYSVDGERVTRRYNNQLWTPLEWGLPADNPAPNYYVRPTSTRPAGYDINRDFNWNLDYVLHEPAQLNERVFGYFVTPEARTWVSVFKELRPYFLFSSHHEGVMTPEDSNDVVVFCLNGQAVRPEPIWDSWAQVWVPVDPALVTLGKQVSINIYDKLNGKAPGIMARYCPTQESHIPRCTQACATFNGCAIFILETRSQGTQKAMGLYSEMQQKMFWTTMEGFLSGEIYDIDVARYEDLPIQAVNIRNPH